MIVGDSVAHRAVIYVEMPDGVLFDLNIAVVPDFSLDENRGNLGIVARECDQHGASDSFEGTAAISRGMEEEPGCHAVAPGARVCLQISKAFGQSGVGEYRRSKWSEDGYVVRWASQPTADLVE